MAPDADGLHTDYAQRLRDRLGEAWSRARTTMGENARTQKQNYDRFLENPTRLETGSGTSTCARRKGNVQN